MSETQALDRPMAEGATASLFVCAFGHHTHDDPRSRAYGQLDACDCCPDLFAAWDIPAPPAIAVACFGPLGWQAVCEHCLADYLPPANRG